jgi:hypothetical protein
MPHGGPGTNAPVPGHALELYTRFLFFVFTRFHRNGNVILIQTPRSRPSSVGAAPTSHTEDWFSYNSEYDVLICIPCGVAILPGRDGGVKGHLEGSHQQGAETLGLSAKDRRELCQIHEGRVQG